MTPISTKRRSLLGFALLPLALPAFGWAAEAQAAVAPIQQLCDDLLAVMHEGQRTPFEKRFEQLAPTIDRVFDLNTILQFSVGPAWNMLPADQKTMLEAAFRRYTVASYVNSFDNFNGQRFEVSPQPRSLANGEQVVQTRIIPTAGDPHTLAYVMRASGADWRAVDVLLDGTISRVAVQRSDFRQLLTRGGAAALAKSLQEKTVDLSGGVG